MRRRHHIIRALAVASALAACSSNEGGPGLTVTVDLGKFAGRVDTMRVVIYADPDGFASQMMGNVKGIGLRAEDFDGNGTLELVATFAQPDATESFRIQTGNRAMLSMNARAMAFDTNDLIASAMGAPTPLAAGGEGAIALRLADDTTGPIGANTRTTDLGTATIDVSIWGHQTDANMSSLAVCDVDGDGAEDIVIGAPGDDGGTLSASGAVYIVWGGWPTETKVDLAQQNGKATVIYGTATGERLGGAVACVDLDGDTIDDVIMGAPGGGTGNRGRIYAVFGRTMFRANRPVDLGSATTGADIVWTTTTNGAKLGSTLFAVGKSRGVAPLVLASAPGALVTHVFSSFSLGTSAAPRMVDADAADHPTVTGVAATALAAGSLDEAPDAGKPLDIALGDPTYREQSDTAMTRGRVYLFPDVALTGTTPIDVASASPTITGASLNSQLGTALLIADTSGGGEDLFVGAPGDAGTGVVYAFKHSTGLLLPPSLSTASTDTTVAIAGDEAGGLFGSALASTRAGSTTGIGLRLAVGAPNVSRGTDRVAIGAAYLYTADAGRKFRIFERIYGKDAGDALGSAVAGGQLNTPTAQPDGDLIGDLVTAAPGARGGDAATGVVYVRYGTTARP